MSKSDDTNLVIALQKTRALIAKGWCQRTFARDDSGAEVDPLSTEATSWCLDGARLRATGDGLSRECLEIGGIIISLAGNDLRPAGWNDKPGRTQEEVLALLDEAIARARVATT